MKLNRLFSAVLSAALLISLCACGRTDSTEDPSAGVNVSAQPSPTSKVSETPTGSEAPPDDSASPAPTPSSLAQYDKDHRLDVPIPELIDGLELPVVGATGYTSVALPLWPSIPNTPDVPVSPEPGPDESPDPGPNEPIDPGPDEPVDPGPDEPVDPGPDEPADPGPDEPVGPGPDEPVEPGPNEPTEPGPDEPVEPGPDEPVGPGPDEPTEPGPDEPSEPGPDEFPESAPEQAQDPTVVQVRTRAYLSTQASVRTLGSYTDAVTVWEPGVAFLILEEDGDWWRVSRGDETGWIEHRYCMINLPDVVPSIIYDDVNAYSSLFVSSGREIPGITGEAFYHSLIYNVRLDRQQFVMPILYSAARNICAAQHRALEEGNCLVVYQTFRPYDTQMAVVNGLTQLSNVDPEVKAGISTSPWDMDWFVASGVSNHQRGYALDISMVKVYRMETRYVGAYTYLYATSYEYYEMPTAMYELSIAAVSTVSPSSSRLSGAMTESAIVLRDYCTSSSLSPLASEW